MLTRNSASTEGTASFGRYGKDCSGGDILSQILNDKWPFLRHRVGQGIPGKGNRLCLSTKHMRKSGMFGEQRTWYSRISQHC